MTTEARSVDRMSVEEELEKAEASELARYRVIGGFWAAVFAAMVAAAVILAVNQMFNLGFFVGFVLIDNRYLYLMVGLLFPLVFLVFPPFKGSPLDRVPWYDAFLAVLTFVVAMYFVWNSNAILDEAWEYVAPETAVYVSLLMWALLIEIGRRTGGIAIFIITIVISLFPTYADMVPNIISGVPQTLGDTAAFHMMSVESLLGIPMRAFGTLVFGFLIFGAALQYTGAGAFFINFAFALLGHVRGGPAKVAIFASGLMGSMSGSVVTNVITTGAMSIPAMKRIGFRSTYAAGVEACASTGGTLMPPIMGATAFVMASFLNVPYVEVVIAAVIPSLLYYFGLFMQIDSYSGRHDMKGLPRHELPSVMQTIKEGWYYIFVFALLCYMLLVMQREQTAPFYATVLLLVINQFSAKHRMDWTKFKKFFLGLGMLLAELAGLLGAIGLIIGSLSLTGMAGTLTNDLVFIAGGNTLLLLIMGAITSFILGIGMTVTAAYIFLAVVLAPALIRAGLDPMGVHMFMLYWGMISFITPPVAIGAFAAASLAKAPPMATGIEAMRIGIVIYFVPFFFVFNPALLMQGTVFEVLLNGGTAMVGIVFLAAAMQGYLLVVGKLGANPISMLGRACIFFAGLFIMAPDGTLGHSYLELLVAGIVLLIPGILLAKAGRKLMPGVRVRASQKA